MSVIFGKNVTAAAPGSAQGLYLVVSDVAAAREELLGRGVKVSEVFHDAGGVHAGPDEPYLFGRLRVSGPDPEHRSYRSFASFHDPDGNGWLFQEITTRLPGRVTGDTKYPSASELSQALRRAEAAHGEHEKRTAKQTPTGPTGTRSIWCASSLAKSCPNERPRRGRPRCSPSRAAGTRLRLPFGRLGGEAVSREPELAGQTVVLLGGSSGIGFETAKRARSEGADVILSGRNPERVEHAARRARRAEQCGIRRHRFQTPQALLRRAAEPDRPHHGHRRRPVLRAAGGHRLHPGAAQRRGGTLASAPRRPLCRRQSASGRYAPVHRRNGRSTAVRGPLITAFTAAAPALTKALAVELAPIRVNLIAPGFVDTPLSASLLGDRLDARREQLRTTLPIRRVVGPADIAALAIHLMVNTAVTGATYDIDGGQQLVEG